MMPVLTELSIMFMIIIFVSCWKCKYILVWRRMYLNAYLTDLTRI